MIFSSIALACAGAASAATLAWAGAFPPTSADVFNAPLAEARGWSAVTLVLAVPLLAFALVAGRRGSLTGTLASLGVVGYLFYTYLEMAVSPPFTALYLVYVAAFASAGCALALGAASVDVAAVASRFGDRAPRRSIAAFSILISGGLLLAWTKDVVTRMSVADYGWPQGADAIGHVVHALDFGLQVPFGFATAALLLMRRPAGFTFGALALVNGLVMGAPLTSMVAVSLAARGESIAPAAAFALMPAASIILGALYLRRPRPRERASKMPDRGLAMTAIGLEVFLSVGALGGGLCLMLGPNGEILPLPIAALAGSPFPNYFWPGLILFTVLGIGPAVVAVLAWRRNRRAPLLTLTVGLALSIWLAVEIAIVGYSNNPPLQPFYAVLGVVITVLGGFWVRHVSRAPLLRAE